MFSINHIKTYKETKRVRNMAPKRPKTLKKDEENSFKELWHIFVNSKWRHAITAGLEGMAGTAFLIEGAARGNVGYCIGSGILYLSMAAEITSYKEKVRKEIEKEQEGYHFRGHRED